jgi:hypothetical protein
MAAETIHGLGVFGDGPASARGTNEDGQHGLGSIQGGAPKRRSVGGITAVGRARVAA